MNVAGLKKEASYLNFLIKKFADLPMTEEETHLHSMKMGLSAGFHAVLPFAEKEAVRWPELQSDEYESNYDLTSLAALEALKALDIPKDYLEKAGPRQLFDSAVLDMERHAAGMGPYAAIYHVNEIIPLFGGIGRWGNNPYALDVEWPDMRSQIIEPARSAFIGAYNESYKRQSEGGKTE